MAKFIKLTDADNDPIVVNVDNIVTVERCLYDEGEEINTKARAAAIIFTNVKDNENDCLEYHVVDTVDQVWRLLQQNL